MTIFDFHVHAFPDTVARRAVPRLAQNSGYTPYADGTFNDTVAKLERWGVDRFVLLNIAATPAQQRNVNDFLIEHNGGPVVSFGSLHPAATDALWELERLQKHGIKGIKFHPEYQNFDIDDPMAYPLYEAIARRDMVMLFHGGFDPAFPGSRRAYPAAAARMAKDFSGAKIVIAHLGNVEEPTETMAHLVGLNVYMDTAMTWCMMKKGDVRGIIKAHGADKILYGSDCPWSGRNHIDFIHSLGLSREDEEAIFHRNAETLLGSAGPEEGENRAISAG